MQKAQKKKNYRYSVEVEESEKRHMIKTEHI